MLKKLFGKKQNVVESSRKVTGYRVSWVNLSTNHADNYNVCRTLSQAEGLKSKLRQEPHVFDIKIDAMY